jgi:hypothetical protein
MAYSIHLVCKRQGLSFYGLKLIDPKNLLYRSVSWELSPLDAEQIIGGWVYLHTATAALSDFGGKIRRVDTLQNGIADREQKLGIVFQVRREARNQKWRGDYSEPAWSGGLVPLALPHEALRPETINSAVVHRRVRRTPSATGTPSDRFGPQAAVGNNSAQCLMTSPNPSKRK